MSEDITWRRVQTSLLAVLVGGPLLATLLCALMFGLGHAIQGARGVAIICAFALGFQALVWLAHSLGIAMLVQVACDVTAGLAYGRLGREAVPTR